MLNEILEAGEYLYDINNAGPKPERIKRTILLHRDQKGKIEFLGLERILIMIARYFIYESAVEYEKALKIADAAIHLWCGHAPSDKSKDCLRNEYGYLEDNYPWIDCWLAEYLRESAGKDKENSKEDIEDGIKALIDYKKSYSVSSLNKTPAKNDFKAIRYDKTIANAAVARGPLKKYYIACRNPEWDRNIRGKSGKVLNENHQDRVLKTISAYMLEKNLKKGVDAVLRFERIYYKSIAHWAVMDTRLDRPHFKPYTVHGEPLFMFQSGMSGNMAKIKPDTKWFNGCGWELIDATENDADLDKFLENNPEGIFYSDKGGGILLEKNVRYFR